MAASVRVEDEAFSDERYDDLAAAAGLTDGDHARGKMARLWRQCTLENCYVLPVATVLRVLGDRGVDALIAARLGELVDGGGGVRIRGTRGRIEWLQKLRDNGKFGKRGGRPRKNPDGLSGKPNRVSNSTETETPPAPAPAPVTTPAPTASQIPLKASRARRLAADWVPERSTANERAEQQAKSRGVDLRAELIKLRDWAAGNAVKRADWDAVWRNWTRNARPEPGQRQQTVLQTLLVDIDAMQREEDES